MAKLKARYVVVGRKGGKPAKLKGKLARIKMRMAGVGKRMQTLTVKLRKHAIKTTHQRRVKSQGKMPKKSHGSVSPKMTAVTSLNELRNKAATDPRYRDLMLSAARNLGRQVTTPAEAYQWLIDNANETTEEGVVEEVNFLRDVIEEHYSQKKAQKVPKVKKVKAGAFTPEELAEIDRAANRTFDYIAGDLMTLIQENEGRSYMKQDEVIEMVVDANRMSSHGGLSRELEDKLYAMPYKAQQKLMRKIFPAKRYS